MDSQRFAIKPMRFGRYQLLERIALGGMAEIFLAAETQSFGGTRLVTVKRIRSDHDDPEYRDFFRTEARVALQCCHPNVPLVHAVGEIDGRPYLAMEFIRGHTLLSFLKSVASRGKFGSVPFAVTVASAIAAALEHVHELRDPAGDTLGVIHRDVTPQNVMLTVDGGIKLLDFGIVRSAVQTHETQAGVVKGKFSYMAPEILAEERELDQRCDLWSVGVLLHEMLVGRPLFRGRSELHTMERIRKLRIPKPGLVRSDVPLELDDVVLKALARDPEERFQSATELLEALEDVAVRGRLPRSRVALRRELIAACGEPPLPVFDGEIYSVASEARVRRLAIGSDSEGTSMPDPSYRAITHRSEVELADHELAYFLDRAGLGSDEPDSNPALELDE